MWKWNLETIPLNNESSYFVYRKFPTAKFRKGAIILLPYKISIILKLKGHIKRRLISTTFDFLKKSYPAVSKLFAFLSKKTDRS